ncbi:MAG: Crp/Fnr family transcriptional regulator [Candidatus Hydrogenedentes bacterium]|nr:Crp/Fnr family transcriptional regulator [Candidatus Hydrogenedentota bacterium]
MDRNIVIECIGKIGILKELATDLRTEMAEILAGISDLRKVPMGKCWIHEHEKAPNNGYVLLEGSVIVRKSGTPDIECEAPEFLGEMMQFMPSHERTASVTALSDCAVLRFQWDDFWKEISAKLSPEHQEKIKEAIKNTTWAHFAQ